MRIHRVHTRQALEPGRTVVLEEGPAHYLRRVLRVAVGQSVVLFNGDGCEYAAVVRRVGCGGLVVDVSSRLPGLPESGLRLTVVQALSRGERVDQALQKCTELGAAAFRLLFTERGGPRLADDRLARRLEHWRGVVVSACEQCGRSRVPEVLAPLDIGDWLRQETGCSRLVLDPGAPTALAAARPGEQLELAVGPEGGFSDGELATMSAHGAQRVSLGPRILRTETAAPAATAILQCLRGDLGPPA